MDNFMILLHILRNEEERHNLLILRRELRDASDPLSVPERTFRGIFRISRRVVHELIQELSPNLNIIHRPEIAIPNGLKILSALHFFAQGSYQKAVGQDHYFPMCQSSVSRCLADVTQAISNHMGYLVKFPRTEEEKNVEKMLFLEKFNNFPGIIGALDCTHVAIQSPPVDDPVFPGIVFYNRKGYYSMNVQIICNANLRILAVNARYPGSVHDSAIWTTSIVQQKLREDYQRGERSSWLIGDVGYPLQPWLMTPIPRGDNRPAARAYNSAHKTCRNVIERLNGALKSRFRCLLRHRTLHYGPVQAAKIINACTILHNLCYARGDNIEDDELVPNDDVQNIEANDDVDMHVNNQRNWFGEGRNVRERILNEHFNGF